MIIDSLEDIEIPVVSDGGLGGDVCEDNVVVGGGEEAPDESAAMLGPVFVIEGGSTSISDSGNNVLRSVEDIRVDFPVVRVRRTLRDSMVMVLVWKE